MYTVRFATWLMLVVLFISGLSVINIAGSSEDASSDMYVTSDAALGSSSFVRSGSGSASDPYIVSDWNMGSNYIRLDNTQDHVLFMNITFTSSSSWAFYFSNAQNIDVMNVTSTGRGRFLYSTSSTSIMIDQCNVTSIPTQANVVDVRNGVLFTISNCRFVNASSSSAAVSFNNQGSSQRFIGNYLKGIPFNDANFGTDGFIMNCTFYDSPVTITGGGSGANILNCHFEAPGKKALTLITSYFMSIKNNFFQGTDGIYFQTMAWQWTGQNGDISNNTFESCERGIGSDFTNVQVRPSKYDVHHNYFGNCSHYAIRWGYGMANRIWNNVFYHNAGIENESSGSQCDQWNWGQVAYKNLWTMGLIGNYWSNHISPDENSDAIVDIPYDITSGGLDTRPSTNPFFDTVPPTIEVTSPTDLYPFRSYLVINYLAQDIGSGVDTIEMKVNSDPWIDVSNHTSRSVFLKQGTHLIQFRVKDKAGLENITTVQYIIDQTKEVIDLISPHDKEHTSIPEVDIQWELEDYFIPTNQTLSIDGNKIYLSPVQRVYRPTLTEGPHGLKLVVSDEMGISVSREANFTVDLTDPQVEILSPQSGSTLSNTFVRLNYNVTDNLGLASLDLNLDGEGWMARPLHETSFSTLLDDGNHTMEVRGIDLSGRRTSLNFSFSIGDTPLLKILEPGNGTSTRDSQVHISWSYSGPFNWNRSLLRVGRSGDFEDIFGQTSLNITLDDDGDYEIILRLMDTFGNYIETESSVIKDTKNPFVGFISPSQNSLIGESNVLVQWGGRDNDDLPMDRYELKVDNGPWEDMGLVTSKMLTLDEGDHSAMVKAVDLAGNIGQGTVSFTIDLTLPQVEFISPSDGSILTDSFLEFSFSSSDNLALSSLNLSIDGRINISVLGKTSHLTTVGVDGEHIISLIAVDTAGNSAMTSIKIIVDTKDPVIEWIDVPVDPISNSSILLKWSIIEELGLSSLVILVDGIETDLDINDRSFTFDLVEGTHRISLKAIDRAGLSTEMFTANDIVVDLTDPTVQIDESRTTIELNNLFLAWNAVDDGSGIGNAYVSLDGGDNELVLTNSTFIYEGLSVGDHFILLTVYDNAMNSYNVNWTFTIKTNINGGTPSDEGVSPLVFIVAVIILFLIFAVIVIMIVLRKKRKEESRIEESRQHRLKKPDRVRLNIPSAPVARSLPPEAPMLDGSQPGVGRKEVEETETGSGYIRPEKKKGSKRKKSRDVQDMPVSDMSSSKTSNSPEDEMETSPPVVDLPDDGPPSKTTEIPVWGEPSPMGTSDEIEDIEDEVESEPSEKASIKKKITDVSWDDDKEEEFEELEDVEEFEDMEDLEDFEELEDMEEVLSDEDDEIEEWE